MKLKGKISISRPIYGDNRKGIEITVIDKTSGCQFLTAYITLENFAEALTGQGHTECELEFFERAPIGKVREVKTEIVPRPKSHKDEEEAKRLLLPFEIDGWEGEIRDMFNGHRRAGDGQKVTFVRFVDAKEGE